MHGIVTLLDEKHHSKVKHLWQTLEAECGLRGIQVTPIPHFSWQVAQDYHYEQLAHILDEVSRQAVPFQVNTGGLGIFTGEVPVLYISVVKNIHMLQLHEKLWNEARDAGVNINAFYSPDHWMPHITVAYGDVDQDTLRCAISRLAFQIFNWEFRVDNLAVISQPDGGVGQQSLFYRFGEDPGA